MDEPFFKDSTGHFKRAEKFDKRLVKIDFQSVFAAATLSAVEGF